MIRRRLPGFRFEAQPPPARDTLPRMDIAALVGFAASGPLHCPVAVEDPAAFAAIFGADAPLAWDERRGEQGYAFLAPAVRAFLRNGGRRCWVVRVADESAAKADRFALPGLLRADVSGSGAISLRPAFAFARSQGRWADALRVGTALAVQAVGVQDARFEPGGQLSVRAAERLRAGDVLRLRFPGGPTAMLAVEQLVTEELASPAGAREVRAVGRAVWLDPVLAQSPPEAAPTATLYTADASTDVALIDTIGVLPDGAVQLTLALALADAPAPGALIRVNAEPDPIWLRVHEAVEVIAGSPDGAGVQISGAGMRLVGPPVAPPPQPPVGDRLLIELRAQSGGGDPLALSDLDLAPAGERWWGALPTDAELFDADAGDRRAGDELWRRAASPRFPLAGRNPELPPGVPVAQPLFTFPIGVEALADALLPAELPPGELLARDGLAEFRRDLFLDPALADALTADLLTKADFIRYLAPEPRALRGIHAALALEEATIIAVPDAAQPAWERASPAELIAPAPIAPIARPIWWRQRGCAPTAEPAAQPPWGEFIDCAIAVIAPPDRLGPLRPPDQTGTFTLSWSPAASDDASYILEEATEPDFGGAVTIYRGGDTQITLYGRSPGDYYYRVRAEAGINTSDWFAGEVVRVGGSAGWVVRRPASDAPPAISTDLLSVQRALLRMCAARGDMFAVLALPGDAREDAAMAHVAALRPSDTPVITTGSDMLDLPLGYGEAATLSYGGVYHPWLTARDQAQELRRTPPDGAICGVLARRALARGAWTAPANERLRDVVALTPPFQRARWLAVQEAQINLIRSEPSGVVALSADTLAADPDLIPISVRRLLSLLRRLALRLGAALVFEPNDDSFRRMVRRTLEAALGELFTRGAFAGRTPDSAYRVVTRATPQDTDAGRLIVDLMVAPSQPLVFLTVRLVQSGGRTTASEER